MLIKTVSFRSVQHPAPMVQHVLFSQVMVLLCPGWIQSMKQFVAGLYEAVYEEGALSSHSSYWWCSTKPLVMSLSLNSYMLCPAKHVRLHVNSLLSVFVWKYLVFPVHFDGFLYS